MSELIVPDMYAGPRKLRRLVPWLRQCPPTVSEVALASLAIADGFRRQRYQQAVAWASAQGAGPWRSRWTALALLANHGRFVAEEALLGITQVGELAHEVELRGGDRLTQCHDGALLLGFHLGPPKTWLRLRALGYPVCFAGRLATAGRDPRWQRAIDAGAVVRLPEGEAAGRLTSLFAMRRLLASGGLLYVTADGPFGREAFRIELPGGGLAVRQGWLALRRAARVPTLPVMSWREGRRRIISIEPPLPSVLDDAGRDAEACRQALTPLVHEFVRAFPSQCRWVALPRWERNRATSASRSSIDQHATETTDDEVAQG